MAQEAKDKGTMTQSFYRGLIIVATIIAGWLFIEDRIKNNFKEALSPLSEELKNIKDNIKALQGTVDILKPMVVLNDYRVNQHEQAFKEFIKPEDLQIKRK